MTNDKTDTTQTTQPRIIPAAPKSKQEERRLLVLSLKGGAMALDPNTQKIYQFEKKRIVIGTIISADVRLQGDGLAPLHAVIELNEDKGDKPTATVYDLASETGVFVNGSKIVTQVVKNGDEITVGPFNLVFNIQNVDKYIAREKVRESAGKTLYLNPTEDLRPLLLVEESEYIEEIFDFRPTQKKALEVVMSWSGTILSVEHFQTEPQVMIGTDRSNHFGVPPMLPADKFPLVTRSGENYTLNIDDKMQGVLQRRGELLSLDALRSRSQKGAYGWTIPMDHEDFAKVTLGGIDFYLSFTAAPPRLKLRRTMEKDPLLYKIFFSSLLMSALVIGGLMSTHVPQQLEAEQLPERIATILYQPEKYTSIKRQTPPVPKEAPAPAPKETPKPVAVKKLEIKPKAEPEQKKPIPKEMVVTQQPKKNAGPKRVAQNESKEGQGARAKGKEGQRGSPKAAAVPGQQAQDKAMRPSPQGGEGRGGGQSQVQDIGNVDFLKAAGGKIENILGNTAANLGKGGEKLKGYGGFTTHGQGGLALAGSGTGGGGDAASLGGLGKTGRGGGRVGTGMGATGSGAGIIGGSTRVAIRTGGPEEAVVMGSIDADAVEAALLAHRDEFRLCYEREINAENPNISGRVVSTFVIGSSGKVTQAGVESSTLKNANAERCILNVIRRIDFPIPRGAGIVQVTYPFKFNPVGR